MKFLFLINIFFVTLVFGEHSLKVATYNVDNLFDLRKNGNEYKEYIPYTKSNWNLKTFVAKLKNLSKVICEMDADILALQEVESLEALKELRMQLKRNGLYYPYFKIASRKNTTVKVAIFSKIPFVYTKELYVGHSKKYRNILEAKFKVGKNNLYVFVNHWKAKSGAESNRIVSAKVLRKRISQIGYDKNIIILGDLNSHYEEYITFKRKRRLNDTNSKTAINHILQTLDKKTKASVGSYADVVFYNLWYDVDKANRYTYIYRGKKDVLDNILISKSLLNQTNLHYKFNSFQAFKRDYLFKGKYIYRWQTTYGRVRVHKAKGFSDHLPVMADFEAP